jgi:hypothetical protein
MTIETRKSIVSLDCDRNNQFKAQFIATQEKPAFRPSKKAKAANRQDR